MCLILFAVNPNERFRLVVAANRDELYARPSRTAGFWDDQPDLLAGRDEQMGGTWLGVTRRGNFAAVTNFREEPADPIPPRSRGELPLSFLTGNKSLEQFMASTAEHGHEYRGFNLLLSEGHNLHYYGNRAGDPRKLPSGCYGLSNQLLDCDWPKVVDGRKKLTALFSNEKSEGTSEDKFEDEPPNNLNEALFDLLTDSGDDREFSNSFIKTEEYGTRAATVVLIAQDGTVEFEERSFGKGGQQFDQKQFTFNCSADS